MPVSPPASVAVLAEQVTRLIRLVSRLKSQRIGDAKGEKAAHILLFILVREGPLRASALAERAAADPSAISRQLADLVGKGLIERRPDPADRRAQLIQITAAGREAVEAMLRRRNEHLAAALDGWPAADVALLAALLTRFVDDIDTHGQGHHRPPGPDCAPRTGPPTINREEN